MAVDTQHPEYAARVADWEMLRISYEGESAVKAAGEKYLPALQSHKMDGMNSAKSPGTLAYEAYKLRAVFPDHVREAVENYIGLLHKKPPVFKLPGALKQLETKATREGESLAALLRRINEQQLVTGRVALVADVSVKADGTPEPYLSLYYAETLINWDESADFQGVNALQMVVLNESGKRRDASFEWLDHPRYRVLMLFAPEEIGPDKLLRSVPEKAAGQPVYAAAVTEGTTLQKDPRQLEYSAPLCRGAALHELPVVIINTKDVVPSTDSPPLLGLGKRCMTIYRGEADYRQTLHLQGQDTLVTVGDVMTATPDADNPAQENVRVGTGARIGLQTGGDAKYIGISAAGIDGQRSAIEADTKLAERRAGDLLVPSGSSQESGEALSTRLAAQTASLTQLADAGALGLAQALHIIERWLGLPGGESQVSANKDFGKPAAASREIVELVTAKTMGAPLSNEAIHNVIRERGLTPYTFEQELELIEQEKPLIPEPEPTAPANGNSNE